MRLTTKGRFAVTAMIDLALRSNNGPVALAAISQRQQISLSYLEQLFGKLRRHELVESTRGPGGGYTLARKAGDITVADIIVSVDEPIDATQCGGKENCLGEAGRCMTHELWASLNQRMVEFLDSVTLQKLVDEQLAKGVEDHSVIFSDFIGRGKRTGPPIMKTVYSEDPYGWGHKVRDFHRDIKGTISDGSRYHALNPELFYWAHATFVEQVLYFADTFVKRLSDAEKEQIYLESKTWYRRYGVSDRPMPATYAEFEEYWDRMMSDVAVPHKTARYGVGYVTKGFPAPKAVNPAVWRAISVVFDPVAAFLTTGGLPPRARDLLELPWTDRQERAYQLFAAAWRTKPVNWVWDRLPMSVRYNTFAQKGYARGA